MGVAQVASRKVRQWNLKGSYCNGYDLVYMPVLPGVRAADQPTWGPGGIAAICDSGYSNADDLGRRVSLIQPDGRYISFLVPGGERPGIELGELVWKNSTEVSVNQFDRHNDQGEPLKKWILNLKTGHWTHRR